MHTALSRLPLLLLPIALFLLCFPPDILDITNIGWLLHGSDNGQNALGMHAWLHDPAPGLLRTHLLLAPEGVFLLFTDSNPLLGLLLRPFAPWLPADAQFIGLWILLCLFLQVFFAWLLLHRFAPGPLALWCGVLLLAGLPTLFARLYHVNLMAHWLILWALWRFLDERRAGQIPGWILLIALTALIHNYLLIMVGAIWASAMIERFVNGDRHRRNLLAVGSILILAMVGGLAWMLGVTEPHALADGRYGLYAMPLDALFNPVYPGFSRFLPATAYPQYPLRGFEGFQYLGLGLLIMLPLAVAITRYQPAPPDQAIRFRRLCWLAPALFTLTLLAIGNDVYAMGHPLFTFPLPRQLMALLDMVRASGRLFWPTAYVLVWMAILVCYRLPDPQARLLLAILLTVQFIDISGLFAQTRVIWAERHGQQPYLRTSDPRWEAILAAAHDISFEPSRIEEPGKYALFEEIAWRAVNLHRPVRTAYVARYSYTTLARQARDHTDFLAGRLDPQRLYVLGPDSPVPATAGKRLMVLDGMRVIVPVSLLASHATP